jgi:hypothetical protein
MKIAVLIVALLLLPLAFADPFPMPGPQPGASPTPEPSPAPSSERVDAPLYHFFFAFLFTNLIEMMVAYMVLRGHEGPKRIIAVVLLCNMLTLPIVWFVFPALIAGYLPALVLGEIFAFAFEAAAYALAFENAGWKKAAGAAVLANMLSLVVGILL